MKKLLIIMVFVLIPTLASADWDFGLSGGLSYTDATWNVGSAYKPYTCPYPKQHKDNFSWNVAGWVKTDVFNLPWELEPIGELNYGEGHYDFGNAKDPIVNFDARFISLSLGLNKEYKHFNGFALIGVSSMFDIRGDLVALRVTEDCKGRKQRKLFIHPPINLYDVKPVFTLGGNYLFDVKKIKLGPQIIFDIYPWPHEFNKCRWFKKGYVESKLKWVIWW